jgi:serine/threonine-protein kinase
MSGTPENTDQPDPVRAEVLQRIVADFETASAGGEHPLMEDHLGKAPADLMHSLFARMLSVELDCRRSRGETPSASEYLARFPLFGEAIAVVFKERTWDKETISEPSGPHESTAAWKPPDSGPGGRYRTVEEIGKGGMGVVFRAFDSELNRDVALKELKVTYAKDAVFRAKFESEAEVTGKLDHPSVVPVHSMGRYEDGRPYYVMRLVEGRELSESIKTFHGTDWTTRHADHRTRALRKLLLHFASACKTVAYAHSRKVIHRDIKPRNIMIGPFGETLVIDWGLARSVNTTEKADPALGGTLRLSGSGSAANTGYGSAVGTPQFMSPEQAAGQLDELGVQSDIFLLGATLYTILVGRPPYEGPNSDVVRAKAVAWEFDPPRKRSPWVPVALEAICLKAMARQPEDRYPLATALADDVENWLADEPVSAYRAPLRERIARWARRHGPWVQAASAAVILVAVISTAAALMINAARRATQVALVSERRALENERTATREAEIQRDMAAGNFRKAADSLEEVINVADRTLATIPRMEASRAEIARKALDLYKKLLEQRPDDPDVRVATARAYRLVANTHRGMNQFDLADGFYHDAIGVLERLVEQYPEELAYRDRLAETFMDAGSAMNMRGQPLEGEKWLLRMREAADFLLAKQPNSPDFLRTKYRSLYGLANSLLATDRAHESAELYDRALKIITPQAEANDAKLLPRLEQIMVMRSLAESLREDGRNTQAKEVLRAHLNKAASLSAANPGENNCKFVLAVGRVEMGRSLAIDPKNRPVALRAFGDGINELEALVRDFPLFQPYRVDLAGALDSRGEVLLDMQQLEPAEADLKRARALLEKLRDDSRESLGIESRLGENLGHLGRLALDRDNRTEARGLFEEAASRHEAALRANPRSRKDAHFAKRIRETLARLAGQ